MSDIKQVSTSVDEDRLLTREDIARYLVCCAKSVYRFCRRRDFPPPDLRVGRSPRWRKSTLTAWLDAQQAKGKKGRK